MRSKFKWILTLLVAFTMQFSFAQEKTITGSVTDASGNAVAGANIQVQGGARKTQTGFDGKYSIKANTGDVLVISFVGMQELRRTVGAASSINVKMSSGEKLEEVIVTGFTKKKAVDVSSAIGKINAAEMEKMAPMTTIDNMLQGKIAGVQVVANGGRPGQPARITIRGANGLNGSGNPLYVVDGVYMTSNEMLSINPADVESQTVLKDAAAAALYGSQGGDGVIVVTTKKGVKGKTTFQLNSSYSFQERVDDGVTMMDATQFLDMQEKLRLNGAALPIRTPQQRATLIQNGTKWQKEIFRQGYIQSNGFQVTSNDENTSFFASIANEKSSGLVRPWNGLERLTGRIKVDQKMRQNITFGANIAMSYTNDDRPRESSNVLSPIFAAFRGVPIIPVYQKDPSGNIIVDGQGKPIFNTAGLPNNINYFDIYENYFINTRQFRTFGGVYAQYDNLFIDKLSFRTDFNGVYTRDARETWIVRGSNIATTFGVPTGQKNDNGFDRLDYRWLNTFNYKSTFGKNHSLDMTLFSEMNKYNNYFYSLSSTGYATNFLQVQSVGSVPTLTNTTRVDYLILGYGLNVAYAYKDRYLFEGSIRRDGNSRFGRAKKIGYFPGASFAWKASEEEFIKSIKAINSLKFRVSFGERGSLNGLNQVYASTNIAFPAYGGVPGAAPALAVAGEDLGWSTSQTLNTGAEFELFNNRLSGTFDYFTDTRSGFYFTNFLPVESGSYTNEINSGEFVNKGYELTLNYKILKNTPLKWTVSANYTNVKSKINDLNGLTDIADGGGNLNRVGQMLNSHFLVRYAGVNSSNGEPLYLDKDGNTTNVFNGGDAVLLENKTPNPTFYGGFGTTFTYKGFDLSGDFAYQGGNYIYNLQEQVLTNPNAANQNFRTDAINFWTTPGQTNVLPKPIRADGSLQIAQETDQFLQKGDFIRFRNLNFGYTLGKNQLGNIPVTNVRFYVQGQNLFTWTDFTGDPEAGIFNSEDTTAEAVGTTYYFQYPNAKSLTFGMQLKF